MLRGPRSHQSTLLCSRCAPRSQAPVCMEQDRMAVVVHRGAGFSGDGESRRLPELVQVCGGFAGVADTADGRLFHQYHTRAGVGPQRYGRIYRHYRLSLPAPTEDRCSRITTARQVTYQRLVRPVSRAVALARSPAGGDARADLPGAARLHSGSARSMPVRAWTRHASAVRVRARTLRAVRRSHSGARRRGPHPPRGKRAGRGNH